VWGKARARRDLRPQGEQQEQKLETSLGIYPSVRAREPQREREKVETNQGT
jgi:hypothetical protein